MPIRFEKNSQRKSSRIALPAEVVVLGVSYPVLDWSFEGFQAAVPPETVLEDGVGPVTFTLSDPRMRLAFEAEARLRRRGEGSAGFSFEQLSDRNKALLSAYISANVAGGEPVVDGPAAPVDATPEVRGTNRRPPPDAAGPSGSHFLGRALFYLVFGCVVFVVVGLVLYHNLSKARSTRGVIAGGLVDVAPEMGGVLTGLAVAEGEAVHAGQLLFSLDDRALLRRVEDIRSSIAVDKERLDYIYVLLKEETRSVGLYREAARRELQRLRAEAQGLDARLAVARKELDRAEALMHSGAVSQSLLDQRREAFLDIRSRREAIEAQLQLAEENVRGARDGKYLVDGKTRGEIRELEAQARVQQKVVAQEELRLSQALAALEHTRVLSRTDGTVYAVKRVVGTSLRPGESVLAVEVANARPWVLARFTFAEAERLAPGMEAHIYVPALDAIHAGRVQALGHHAMGSGDVQSLDQEISLNEVPVKVVFDAPPGRMPVGLGVSVSVDTPWLRAVKALF